MSEDARSDQRPKDMKYTVELSPLEVRILGCLIEKEATTPDAYPLSLNGLTNACNQKTNRDPVMSLDERTVQEALDGLTRKTLTATRSGAGSRVTKYVHRLNDRLRTDFDFSREELAVLCVLFLRGPQTPGEVRTRCQRIHGFPDMDALHATLERLETREDGPYVVALPRQPGQKEARHAHLLCGDVDVSAFPIHDAHPVSDDAARIAELELRVARLTGDIEALTARFDAFAKQFE